MQQAYFNSAPRPHAARKQSPALETPLPEFVPPQGQRGQDIMIIWDFQNVRTPTELEPVEIIRFMYDTFVKHPGPRRCAGAFCTFTDSTKKAVGEKRFNQFCSNGVLNFMMINSPGGPRKADDSDHPLKEMMMNFTVDCVRGSKDGVLLLITADADFVRPAIWCKQQGCVSLELIYYDPIASKEIRQLEANWKMEWRDFLDCMMGRRCPWTFPYPQDVAAGLVPNSSSSGSSNSYNYNNYSNGGNSYQSDAQRRQQLHRPQQQQQLHLPAPPPRLALPPAGGSSSSSTRQVYTATGTGVAAAAPAAVGAITVSNTHVDQAAEQLLHNPAALQQVMQQYKQSMQTTAVLQQVLQGVAHKASTGSAAPAAAAAGGGAAGMAGGYMRAGTMQPQQQQQQQQQRSSTGVFMMQPNKPVTLLRRNESGAASSSAGGVGGSSSAQGLTWQQKSQGSTRLTTDSSTNGGRSPPPPEWWDPAAAAAAGGRSRRDSKGSAAAGGAGGISRHSSSNGAWGAASGGEHGSVQGLSDDQRSSEGDDGGFWDSPQPGAELGSGHRSNSSGRLPAASSSSGGAAPAAEGALPTTGLPPPPSMGLMKRAAGTAGSSSGGKTSGSGGNLAALLAAAAASSGSPAKPSAAAAGRQSPLHHHGHHQSQGSDGVLSPVDKHELHHQQALAAAAAAGRDSGMQQQQPRLAQQHSYGSLEQLRSPSPALSSSRSDRGSQPVQDRHMHHHEQQLLLAMQRNSKQRPFHEPSSSTDAPAVTADRGAVNVNLFGGSKAERGSSSYEDSSPNEHTGLWVRPKAAPAGPGMAAAARILSRATAEAAADVASRSSATSAAGGDEGSDGVPAGGRRRSSSTGGAVEIMEAPLPPWMTPPQQQQQAEATSQQQEPQQHQQQQPGSSESSAGCGEVVEEYVVDDETGEVILVKKQQQRAPAAQPSRQQPSSAPVDIVGAAAAAAAASSSGPMRHFDEPYASSEGGITPSNTPCSAAGSWHTAGAAAAGLGFRSTHPTSTSRLQQWQQPSAGVDAAAGAAAARAGQPCLPEEGCSSGPGSSSCNNTMEAGPACNPPDSQQQQQQQQCDESAGSIGGTDQPLVRVLIRTAGDADGKDVEVLLTVEAAAATASRQSSSDKAAAPRAAAAATAQHVSSGIGNSSSSSSSNDPYAAAEADDEVEVLQPLLGVHDESQALPQPQLLPLSTSELEALVAISQGIIASSSGCVSLTPGAEGMLPLPSALVGGSSSSRGGVDGLSLLGPVLLPTAGAAAASCAPHHRPKQRSIVEQLEELQHILSADLGDAAAAATAAEGDDEELGSGACLAAGDSEGLGTDDDGLGFEAVGLDGLPVYGPHPLPPSQINSEDGGDDAGGSAAADGDGEDGEGGQTGDEQLLRLFSGQHPGDSGADDVDVQQVLQLLNAGVGPEGPAAVGFDGARSTPLVLSGPPLPLHGLSSSPVTAITELGNVSSTSSSGSPREEKQTGLAEAGKRA